MARGSEATWTFISEGRVLFFLPWRHTRGSSPALQFTLQTTRAHCAINRPPGNTLWIAHQYNTNSAATQELDLFIPSAPSWELSVQENRCGERRVIYRACSEDQMPFISPLHQQLQTFSGEGQKDDLGSPTTRCPGNAFTARIIRFFSSAMHHGISAQHPIWTDSHPANNSVEQRQDLRAKESQQRRLQTFFCFGMETLRRLAQSEE